MPSADLVGGGLGCLWTGEGLTVTTRVHKTRRTESLYSMMLYARKILYLQFCSVYPQI